LALGALRWVPVQKKRVTGRRARGEDFKQARTTYAWEGAQSASREAARTSSSATVSDFAGVATSGTTAASAAAAEFAPPLAFSDVVVGVRSLRDRFATGLSDSSGSKSTFISSFFSFADDMLARIPCRFANDWSCLRFKELNIFWR